jgi:UDP-N-acetyl-D-galactosamine dehydrogenase
MSDRIRSVGRGKDSLNAVNTTVGVVGLGYVGLRLAHAFDEEGYTVHGFDVNERKVRTLREGDDPTRELDAETLARSSVSYTADPAQLEACEFILLAVPTPVDTSNRPNLDAVEAAGRTVGEHMATGTTVVLESTVYPGATRDTLMPVLESASGMPAGEEFFVGYSPERITPGEDGREFRDIVKVVSGQDDRTAQRLRQLYQRLIDVEVHVAPTIEAAEAAKCLENVQRDLNIGLLNEFAIACSETRLDIDSQAVLAAAETKWNFHRYRPGLVGGHCLPVDPYFIIDQFERNGYVLELPRVARHVNERVPRHLVARLADALERRLATRHDIDVTVDVLYLEIEQSK